MQPLLGVSEVAVPADRGRTVLLRLVCAQPVLAQRRQLPGEFGMPVPQRWDDADAESVGVPQPVDPGVQLKPFDLRLLGGEQVPVDWSRGLRGVRIVFAWCGHRLGLGFIGRRRLEVEAGDGECVVVEWDR